MILRSFLLIALIVPTLAVAQEDSSAVFEVFPPAATGQRTDDPDAVLRSAERMPEFPGGTDRLMEYMRERMEYPQEALEEGIGGRVFVGFVVEKDGSLSDIKVERSAHRLLDQAALRTVRNMPRWEPGMQDGQPVRVAYTLPITFVLSR